MVFLNFCKQRFSNIRREYCTFFSSSIWACSNTSFWFRNFSLSSKNFSSRSCLALWTSEISACKYTILIYNAVLHLHCVIFLWSWSMTECHRGNKVLFSADRFEPVPTLLFDSKTFVADPEAWLPDLALPFAHLRHLPVNMQWVWNEKRKLYHTGFIDCSEYCIVTKDVKIIWKPCLNLLQRKEYFFEVHTSLN